MNTPVRNASREARLLVITLVVSIGALLLLARFRFPDRPLGQTVTAPTPLERIASTVAFDDLDALLDGTLDRVSESVVVLRVPDRSSDGREPVHVPGLRVRDDLAIASVADRPVLSIDTIDAVDGDRRVGAPIVARDAARNLVMVRVPPRPAPVLAVQADPLPIRGYMVGVHAGFGGATAQAIHVSRADAIGDSSWRARVLALAPSEGGSDGTLLFTPDGRFVGLVQDGPPKQLVPAAALLQHANMLADGKSFTGVDPGFTVQPLTPAMQAVTGAKSGVIIAWIDPSGPAANALRRADVVVAIDGEPISSVGGWRRALARHEPGVAAALQVERDGVRITVPALLRAASAAHRESADSRETGSGLTLRQRGAEVEIVHVAPGTPASSTGLQPGDRIVWVRGLDRPTAMAIESRYRHLASGQTLLVGIRQAAAEHAASAPEQLRAIRKP